MPAKSKFDSLLDPTPTTSRSPAPAKGRNRAEPLEATSTQYGKRRDDRYTQISGLIPADLKRRFKAKVALDDVEISAKLEELIAGYVDGS